MPFNLSKQFIQRAAEQPNHPLILGPDDTCITYSDFADTVQEYAEKLYDVGVRPGMNIGLHYPNGPTYIAYTYALWACDACVTPIPVELADQEKQHFLHHIALNGVISAEHSAAALKAVQTGEPKKIPDQCLYIPTRIFRDPPQELAGLNPAFIRFTSGTTGTAKGVVLSHETIHDRILAANQGLHIGPQDRVLWLLSMAYHFAVSICAYLNFGATIILPKNSFGISLLHAANQHQATLIYGAPTHYELMTHDTSDLTLPSVRLAVVTTARLRREVADTFYQRFGRALNETYGLIELGLPAINLEHPRERQGSVGGLLPDYQVKLQGQTEETPGEIFLRGPGLLDAYYDPWQSRETLLEKNNGWLATGDLGIIDEKGCLTIVGRSKEMISVGGMKFFPDEVEYILEQHPAVDEACVFGYPDRRFGEIPYARLVQQSETKQPDLTELKQFCSQFLAGYKVPKQYQFVPELPRTASGKLIRRVEPGTLQS